MASTLAVFAAWLLTPPSVSAQDAAVVESILESDAVTRAQLRTVLVESGLSVPAPEEPERPLRVDELAAVIVTLEGVDRSLGWALSDSPRYAVRTARDESLFPDTPRRLPAGSIVDGGTFLTLIRSPLFAAVERGEPETVSIPLRGSAGATGPPWGEVDVRQLVRGDLSDEEGRIDSTSTISGRIVAAESVELRGDIEIETGVDDSGSDTFNPAARELVAALFLEPEGRGPTATIELGRRALGPFIADGLRGSVTTADVSASAYIAYTGLTAGTLNALPEVQDDAEVDRERPFGDAPFAPRRLVTGGGLVFPELLGRQSPGLSVNAALDPEFLDEAEGADRVNLTETAVTLAGSLGRFTFYNARGAFQLGQFEAGDTNGGDGDLRGWIMNAEIRHFPGGFSRRRVSVEAMVASGDDDTDDDSDTAYQPLTSETPWSAYPGEASNVGALRLGGTARFTDRLRVNGDVVGLARLTESADGQDGTALGADFSGTVGFRPIRDLIITLDGSIFVPVEDNYDGDSAWNAGLSVTVEL